MPESTFPLGLSWLVTNCSAERRTQYCASTSLAFHISLLPSKQWAWGFSWSCFCLTLFHFQMFSQAVRAPLGSLSFRPYWHTPHLWIYFEEHCSGLYLPPLVLKPSFLLCTSLWRVIAVDSGTNFRSQISVRTHIIHRILATRYYNKWFLDLIMKFLFANSMVLSTTYKVGSCDVMVHILLKAKAMPCDMYN